MTKVCTELSDKEYEILQSIKMIEGSDGEKLKNLFRHYLSTIPELRSMDYALKRFEDKEEIDEILKDVYEIYKKTEYPVDEWENDKIDRLIDELTEINVLIISEGVRTVSSRFRDLFKMLLHDIVTENRDLDEHKGAIMAVIQLLKEFGVGTLSKETIRDDAILLNEGWLFVYAKQIRKAREFLMTKKLSFLEEEPQKQPGEMAEAGN
ncbi:MAG TPA: hypothetical protein VIO11_09750 [Candidatus Methanoperedens sp.]